MGILQFRHADLRQVRDTPEMPLRNHPNSQALFYRRDAHSGERVVGATASRFFRP